jgi:hypothetical protein
MAAVAERLRDADVLKALPYAKGFDRELLISALGHSEGSAGPAMLRHLYASENGHARSAALSALGQRCGAAATDLFTQALRSRSIEVQGMAALSLAEYGTADAAEAVFEWLDRKLGRKRRASTWDPYELPSAIRFAARHGMHAEAARTIARHWAGLEREERDWLRRTWPALFDGSGSPIVAADMPPPAQVQWDIFEDERGDPWSGESDTPDELDEDTRRALVKATREALRAEGNG